MLDNVVRRNPRVGGLVAFPTCAWIVPRELTMVVDTTLSSNYISTKENAEFDTGNIMTLLVLSKRIN